jgi:DNA-binding transcriptional MerR regulator
MVMSYSIGEVAKTTGIAISTLRYYDREGLFLNMERTNGNIRVFSDTEIDTIKIIECLKTSGMPIKDIKRFLDWSQEGDESLQKRRDMFYERLEVVTNQMKELQKTMDIIRYKCWYYDTALTVGTEDAPKNMPIEKVPEEIQKYKRGLL